MDRPRKQEAAETPRQGELTVALTGKAVAGKTPHFTGMSSIGVAVGKFNPPHLGHLHLLQQASEQVDQLYVLLCDHPAQTLLAEQRRRWLVDAAPANVSVLVTPDDLPTENAPWAERALALLPRAPNLAFTSEAWGPGWADLMGARHVMVDQKRSTRPISARQIRAEPAPHFHWLVPAARAALCKRVVLVGAESTGKSTMAEALAREFGTAWVPEHGRWYWEGRRHLEDQTWSSDELRRIAAAQRRLEDDLARRAVNGILFVDTDALMTAVWHERYLARPDPELDQLATEQVPTLYLVCSPDFEWVQDGTRESKTYRAKMHESVVARAEASGAKVAYLTGSHEQRLAEALTLVRPLTHFDPLV